MINQPRFGMGEPKYSNDCLHRNAKCVEHTRILRFTTSESLLI